jgi:hypothetical protein
LTISAGAIQFMTLGAIHAGITQVDEVFVQIQGGMLFLHHYSSIHIFKKYKGHFGAFFIDASALTGRDWTA